MATISEQVAHQELVSGGATTQHSHAVGGDVIKKGRESKLAVAKGYGEHLVSFGYTFASVPYVIVSLEVPAAAVGGAHSGIVLGSISTSGFTAFILNNTGAAADFAIQWEAIQ